MHGLAERPGAMEGRCPAYVLTVRGEPMVDARRQDNEIPFLQPNAHPLVVYAPYVEKALPVEDVSNLLVLVQVLVEKHLDLVLVH